ncbi:MAG: glucosamine inositolphosphorylceramide transferase family protein [Bacillota bacterium]
MLSNFVKKIRLRRPGKGLSSGPITRKGRKWSIGLYRGTPLGQLVELPGNPIITAADIDDCRASFVADPFIIKAEDKYYLFFEVLNLDSGQGEIGLAISSDGTDFAYQRIILSTPWHLSYPWVFSHEDQYYMLPEMNQSKTVTLYQASNFPLKWEPVQVMLSGQRYRDSSIIYYKGFWWLFTTWDDTRLQLYYAKDLLSADWHLHPSSPVAIGRYARPAGRILEYRGELYRPAQDPLPGYGSRVMLHHITTLTPTAYAEKLIGPYLAGSGTSWNAERMHHVDFLYPLPVGLQAKSPFQQNQWLVVTDGYKSTFSMDLVRAGLSRMKRRRLNV